GNQPPSRTVVQTGPATGKPLKTFTVDETEFTLSPSTFTVTKTGTYTFPAVNRGRAEHSLEIGGRGIEKKLESNLQPGQSGDLTVVLTPGTYDMYCPVDGHKAKGMEGTIKVAGAKGSTPTTTTSSGGGY